VSLKIPLFAGLAGAPYRNAPFTAL